MIKKILVDLSATLIHHGHIRLLKKASKYGKVVVALTSDEEVKKYKGYNPELDFNKRKEILESIKYVNKVIKSKWLIKDSFLKKHKINYLVHGSDNRNKVDKKRIIIFKRTKGISSTILRKKACKALK
jgi:glycerol-3-phosphate cytidylyltransferase